MSSLSEVKEEKVETVVDVENYDFTNDLFRKTYGSATIDDAQVRTARMADELENNPRQPSRGFVNEGLEVITDARLSVFAKEKLYEGDWSSSSLNFLESWHKVCKDSAAAYAKAARKARTSHRFMAIPTIVAGTAATALAFFSAGESCDADAEDNNGLKYSAAFFTSLVSVLGGIQALYSFDRKVAQCINASGNFENLARQAQIVIFLPNKLRAHSELVLTEISTIFSHLTTSSPLL